MKKKIATVLDRCLKVKVHKMLGRQTNVYVSRHNMYKAYCTMFTQPIDKLDFQVCHR